MSYCDASIVILAHNGVRFTQYCLESLLASPTKPRELFLVDNASTDRTPELIAEAEPRFLETGVRFVTWRNSENKGCSLARNEAWERATSTYTVFLDNDVAVCTRDWLQRLVGKMHSRSDLAVLGPKMIYPFKPHPIQCAGVSLTPLGRVCFRGRGRARFHPRFCRPRRVPALISACWIMRTRLCHEIGYLDELFHPVQYEDLDFCLRAVRAGWQVAYTPEVEMYHFEGITTESFGGDSYRRNVARNSTRFRQRWHDLFPRVAEDLPPDDLRWLSREEMGLTPDLEVSFSDAPASDETPESA